MCKFEIKLFSIYHESSKLILSTDKRNFLIKFKHKSTRYTEHNMVLNIGNLWGYFWIRTLFDREPNLFLEASFI